MNLLLPIQRVRLELDRTLRGRAFFARALRDELTDDAYADLVAQLAALLDAVGGESGPRMSVLAREDVARLAAPRSQAEVPAPPVETACRMFAHAPLRRAAHQRALQVTYAVVGSPWSGEVAERIETRTRRARAFLDELATRGARAMRHLRATSADWAHDSHSVHAFAEMTRGAFLGLATWLESTWPAPLLAITLDIESR